MTERANNHATARALRPARSILRQWELTEEEFTEIVRANPSMRGLVLGYVAEYKLRKLHFSDPRFTSVVKDDDHDRKKKGDLRVVYRGREFRVECKSLQTRTVRRTPAGFAGRFSCDASDRRKVALPNGETLATTCLVAGGFELVAVNLFAFEQRWRFAFALERDLPRSGFTGYTPAQREHLLATLPRVAWPLQPPFEADPFGPLDRLAAES